MTNTATRPELNQEFRNAFSSIAERVVPAKYKPFSLKDLQPSEASRLPLGEQARLYDEMRANELAGWAFFAPAGYSKTTCSYALFRRAILANLKVWWPRQNEWPKYEWEPEGVCNRIPRIYVWRKSVPDLLQQHFDRFNYVEGEGRERPPKPAVSVESIEEAVRRGYTPRVFLEEIDKVKPSEFAINQIFRIFDALDRHKGQLVIDTNLSKQQFMDVYGEPITRRVKENCIVKEWGF